VSPFTHTAANNRFAPTHRSIGAFVTPFFVPLAVGVTANVKSYVPLVSTFVPSHDGLKMNVVAVFAPAPAEID
jgi:hypothetical protein